MNLVQLKYFKAVCLYGSVSAAAKFLHISQPSLSGSIKELEREFGVALFLRQHKGMVLTAEGETLLEMSRDLLGRAERIENVMGELGRERHILRLGVPPMIGSLVLPRIYREFSCRFPEITLEICEDGRQELQKKLSEGYLDMVFLPHSRPLEKMFSSEKVGTLEIACCASKDHPVSRKSVVEPKELCNVPLVLYKNGFYQTEEIKRWFAASGVNPEILLQSVQLSTVETIISSGIAVGFLFRRLIEGNPMLRAVPAKSPINVDVSLVWKRDAYFFNCMKNFREYVKKNPCLKADAISF